MFVYSGLPPYPASHTNMSTYLVKQWTMMMTIMVIMMKLGNKVFSEELNICVVLSVQASLRSRLCGARWGFHSILACSGSGCSAKMPNPTLLQNKSKPHCSRLYICQISFYRPLMHQIHIYRSIIFNLILP